MLAIQFAGASFILTLMVIVTMQFRMMRNADHGYRTEGVYYSSTVGMEPGKVSAVLNELRSMPEVEIVGLGYGLPVNGASGNNVRSPDGLREMFNVADFYVADENYLSILDIRVSEGLDFSPENAAVNDVIISVKGAELLKINNGWNDGVVGKPLEITEHGSTTIRGVFPDFIIKSLADPDLRPAVFFYLPEPRVLQTIIDDPASPFKILVKVSEGSEAGIKKKIAEVMNLAMPYRDATVSSLGGGVTELITTLRGGFRKALMAGNIVYPSHYDLSDYWVIHKRGDQASEGAGHTQDQRSNDDRYPQDFCSRARICSHSLCSGRPDRSMVYCKQVDAELCGKGAARLVAVCFVQHVITGFGSVYCRRKLLQDCQQESG